ncbi:MAG: hypothetical protein U9N42_08045 [Campylobacterota bacterium]|nr:hypothetical protein [Campylobacterota bacterium]
MKKLILILLIGVGLFAQDIRCKDPSDTYSVREDLSDRVNYICKEDNIPADTTCKNVAGTYSIAATFDASHCGSTAFMPANAFTVYVTQQDCTITVTYEDHINPDTGSVDGATATFSGTSLIGDVTDIHYITVTKSGNTINGTGSSTLSGPNMAGCVITKSIAGKLVK